MLLDYVIVKLSESETTKGVFSHYIITEGVSKMLMHDYGGWEGCCPFDDIS